MSNKKNEESELFVKFTHFVLCVNIVNNAKS